MKKTSFYLFLALILIATQPAVARSYFGVRGGYSDVHENNEIKKYNSVGFGSGYIGVSAEPFRLEGEYTYVGKSSFKNEVIPLQVNIQRASANAYIDMAVARYVRPYIGVGAGSAFYSVKTNKNDTEKKSGTNFAWNAGGGVGVKLTRNLTFDTGYRYVDMGEVETDNHQLDLTAHEAYLGLRFLF